MCRLYFPWKLFKGDARYFNISPYQNRHKFDLNIAELSCGLTEFSTRYERIICERERESYSSLGWSWKRVGKWRLRATSSPAITNLKKQTEMRSYLTKCEHFPKPQLLTLQFHLEGDCREPRGSLQLSRLNSGGILLS